MKYKTQSPNGTETKFNNYLEAFQGAKQGDKIFKFAGQEQTFDQTVGKDIWVHVETK